MGNTELMITFIPNPEESGDPIDVITDLIEQIEIHHKRKLLLRFDVCIGTFQAVDGDSHLLIAREGHG